MAIILVVIGHSLHEYDSSHGTHTFVYQFIYSFHMPLFVFISGYLLSNSMISHGGIKPYRDFVKDKTIRLLLPYTMGQIKNSSSNSFLFGRKDKKSNDRGGTSSDSIMHGRFRFF